MVYSYIQPGVGLFSLANTAHTQRLIVFHGEAPRGFASFSTQSRYRDYSDFLGRGDFFFVRNCIRYSSWRFFYASVGKSNI